MLYKFEEFILKKVPQKKETSPIVDKPKPEDVEKIEDADKIEPKRRLKKDENKMKDYYDAKQDFVAPKPFRKD